MTNEERFRAQAFAKCRFPAASFVKRFARDIGAQANGSGNISDRQAARLCIEAYRYRRQMPRGLAPEAPPPGYETTKQRSRKADEELRLRKYREQNDPAPQAPLSEEQLTFES